MAAGRVVDLRRRVCDSHWARTFSTSELASARQFTPLWLSHLGHLLLPPRRTSMPLTAGTGNQGLLALALVIWPIMTGVPAFVVALVAARGTCPSDRMTSPAMIVEPNHPQLPIGRFRMWLWPDCYVGV